MATDDDDDERPTPATRAANLRLLGSVFRAAADVAGERGLDAPRTFALIRRAFRQLAGPVELPGSIYADLAACGRPDAPPGGLPGFLRREADKAVAEAEKWEAKRA